MTLAALFDGLADFEGSTCLDACAAPGNKTSQLSDAVYSELDNGVVHAIDMDRRRLDTLDKQMLKFGCVNVVSHCQSFLDADPHA